MRTVAWIFAAGCLSAAGTSACAVTTPTAPANPPCVVEGAALLPAETGGEEALCDEIRRATADVMPAGARISVQIMSDHLMHGTVTLQGGRSLPRITTAVSDRTLSPRSFRMMAAALADQLRSTKS